MEEARGGYRPFQVCQSYPLRSPLTALSGCEIAADHTLHRAWKKKKEIMTLRSWTDMNRGYSRVELYAKQMFWGERPGSRRWEMGSLGIQVEDEEEKDDETKRLRRRAKGVEGESNWYMATKGRIKENSDNLCSAR